MNTLLARHRSKLIALAAVLGFAALIWLDARDDTIAEGTEAPAFQLTPLGGGEPVTVASMKGRPAVLDFWATWCPPCRESLPVLDRLAEQYGERANFYAVNAEGEPESDQRKLRDELGLKLTMLPDGAAATRAYGVSALPTTVVLDREGRVFRTFTGAVSAPALSRVVDEILAAGPKTD